MSLAETETRADPLARALAHIDANLFEPLPLAEIAGAAASRPSTSRACSPPPWARA